MSTGWLFEQLPAASVLADTGVPPQSRRGHPLLYFRGPKGAFASTFRFERTRKFRVAVLGSLSTLVFTKGGGLLAPRRHCLLAPLGSP